LLKNVLAHSPELLDAVVQNATFEQWVTFFSERLFREILSMAAILKSLHQQLHALCQGASAWVVLDAVLKRKEVVVHGSEYVVVRVSVFRCLVVQVQEALEIS